MGRHSDMDISKNLVAMATQYRKFLKEMDPYVQTILEDHVLSAAVRRYETCWLPLKRKWEEVLPPRDVYWVWHVHMLSPVDYQQDCLGVVQGIPDHSFITDDHDGVLPKSREVWKDLYPQEEFDLDPKVIPPDYAYTSKCSYDLVSAAKKEACYFYNISLPHFTDNVFLMDAEFRYRQFLHLKLIEPDLDLDPLPVFDIDLIWRGHMMNPLVYRRESTALLGRVLGYNSEGVHTLTPNDNRLNVMKAWRHHFRQELFLPGCRHRGPHPRRHIHVLPQKSWETVSDEEKLRLKIEPAKFKSEIVFGGKCLEAFGPMSLGFVPPDAEIHVDRAEHVVTDSEGNHLLTLRIVHTVDVHLSVVQLFHQGDLVAMSHVIGHEQLAATQQLGPGGCPLTISALDGERVMLVKTALGDDCVVKGKWKGHVPGDDLRKPQAKGALELTVIKLNRETDNVTSMEISPFEVDDATSFTLQEVQVDMNSGEIVIPNTGTKSGDMLGRVCAALSGLIIYILCEPRFEDGPMGIEEVGAEETPGGSTVEEFPAEEAGSESEDAQMPEFKRSCKLEGCVMLKILGLGSEVPTNNWFFWLFHRRMPEVYCPWDPERCHRVIKEQMRLSKLQSEEKTESNQALWIMLISVIVLLVAVIATLVIVYYDYQLPV